MKHKRTKQRKKKEERTQRREGHDKWADKAMERGAGVAHKLSKPTAEHENIRCEDVDGQATGCPHAWLLQQVGEWEAVWNTDAGEDEHAAAMAQLTEALGSMPPDLAPITRHDVDEAAKKFKQQLQHLMASTPKGLDCSVMIAKM